MSYESVHLQQSLAINQIVTIHYFEYMSDFSFPGETHDFWEILCVDKGVVNVIADTDYYTLKKDEIIFHKPNEFHNLKANGFIAPNLVVISFICNSPSMKFFENKILSITDDEKKLLANIILEARKAYINQLNDPYFEKLIHSDEIPFGTEQLIKIYLEQFLIQLFRKYSIVDATTRVLAKSVKEKSASESLKEISIYLENNVQRHLSIEQICKDMLIGRSQLQGLFRTYKNCGVIDYFCKLKIETAKQLIRDKHMNFTQISDYLGYASIHYFSRQFKKITGMSPSEYSSSIKRLSEKPFK